MPGYSNGRWWPFDTDSLRLAPDTTNYSWYCEYIGLRRGTRAHLAVARFTVHIPKLTGGGSFGVTAEVEINVRDRTTTVLSSDLTEDLTTQARWKAAGVLELLVSERDCRRGEAQRARTLEELLAHRNQANDDQ